MMGYLGPDVQGHIHDDWSGCIVMGGPIDVGIFANFVHNDILYGVPIALKLHGNHTSPYLQQHNQVSDPVSV